MASRTARCACITRPRITPRSWAWEAAMADSSSRNLFAAFGHRLIEAGGSSVLSAAFFAAILRDSGASLRRFPLVIREIYFAGVLSMIIIVVSGLFVGMVLGFAGLFHPGALWFG